IHFAGCPTTTGIRVSACQEHLTGPRTGCGTPNGSRQRSAIQPCVGQDVIHEIQIAAVESIRESAHDIDSAGVARCSWIFGGHWNGSESVPLIGGRVESPNIPGHAEVAIDT